MRDITERKQAQDALRESEEKYRGLIEDSHVGIAVSDLEGKFTFVNQALCEMAGYSKEELLDRYFINFVHPEDREEILGMFREGIAAPTGAIDLEFRIIHKKGHVVHMTASPMPLKEGNKPAGVIALLTDITQVKRQEELIHELAEVTRQERAEIGGESALSVASGRPLTPLQEKFVKSGLENFDDREAIELLMSICNCGRQKAVTKQCFKAFVNIREVLSASQEELEQAGFAPQCILYLKLLREIPREVLRERIRERAVYESSKEVFDYLYYSMRDLKEEVFKIIYLDSREGVIDIVDLFEGETGTIYVQPREIVETAIRREAASLLFVHNHPSGDPKPGKLDKKFTRDLVFVGNILQIRVLDHIIIGEDRYFSFADEGLVQQYEDDFLNVRIRRI
jgi:DNA repair protein RadC